jgi:hypothetical protein
MGMDFSPILELLSREPVPSEKVTGGFLRDAVAKFAADPTSAVSAIRRLQASDPSGLALAAVRLLVAAEGEPQALQYLATLALRGTLLTDLLLDARALPLQIAVPLAREVSANEPLLDIRLVRAMIANAGGNVHGIKNDTALRVLALIEAISGCSRLASYLVQCLSHPSAKVRSKAALLLGRANRNLTRVESLLASNDSRVRANAVESLRAHQGEEVRRILRAASHDPSSRVAVNALLGLCQAGDREAFSRLAQLAHTADPALRSGAAWAMGETGDPEFREALEKLLRDDDAKVRAMAEKSGKKLRPAAS